MLWKYDEDDSCPNSQLSLMKFQENKQDSLTNNF